jgi:oxalate decarboxylase
MRDPAPATHAFVHRMLEQTPQLMPGGTVRITDTTNFPASKTIAAALVELEPGGLRELHWHPNGDEWQFNIEGEGRMTVSGSEGRARTFDYRGGDVGYVPFAMGQYIENTGSGPMRFLEVFRSSRFADFSLNQWMKLTPRELVRSHLDIDQALLDGLSAEKHPVLPASRKVP